jgi:hypothetical protein
MPVAFDQHIASLDTFLATHLNKVQSLRHGLAAVPSTSETITPLLSLEGVNVQFDTLTNQFGVVVVTVSKRSTWITFSNNFYIVNLHWDSCCHFPFIPGSNPDQVKQCYCAQLCIQMHLYNVINQCSYGWRRWNFRSCYLADQGAFWEKFGA